MGTIIWLRHSSPPEYTFDHLGLDPVLRNHVSTDFFEAGHMMYTYKPPIEKL